MGKNASGVRGGGSSSVKSINDALVVLKGKQLQGIEVQGEGGKKYVFGPNDAVLYHPTRGFLAFSNEKSPYVPNGGAKVLQSILDGGGFTSFNGIKFMKPANSVINYGKMPVKNGTTTINAGAKKFTISTSNMSVGGKTSAGRFIVRQGNKSETFAWGKKGDTKMTKLEAWDYVKKYIRRVADSK